MVDFTEQLNTLIKSRRSTKPRLFNGNKIDDEIIWQILENANWAPNHGLTQPWKYQVFSESGLNKLAEFQATLYQKTIAPEKFKSDKYERMKSNILKSSHVIAIGMERQKSETIPEIEEIEAVACSVQNMALTAAAYGICGFWGSGGVTYTSELKEFLGLGEKDRCLGCFYLGYSDTPTKTSRRNSIKESVIWIT